MMRRALRARQGRQHGRPPEVRLGTINATSAGAAVRPARSRRDESTALLADPLE